MSRRQKNDMSSNLRHCPDRPVKNGGGSADLGNRAQCQARTRRPCRGLEIPEGGAWRRFRAPGIFPRTRRRPPAPPPTPPPVSAATALREATHPPPPSSPPPLPPPLSTSSSSWLRAENQNLHLDLSPQTGTAPPHIITCAGGLPADGGAQVRWHGAERTALRRSITTDSLSLSLPISLEGPAADATCLHQSARAH